MKTIWHSIFVLSLLCLLTTDCNGQAGRHGTEVLLETTEGNIRILLYDDTPRHRDNFVANVRSGMYDGVSFHRVIRNFMVQTGDPDTREGDFGRVEPDSASHELGPSIAAEIVYPKHFHRAGVVAAAREGDDVNPERRSSKYQFYIVTGKFQNETAITAYEQRKRDERTDSIYQAKLYAHSAEIDSLRRERRQTKIDALLSDLYSRAQIEMRENPPALFTQEQLRAYRTYGGTPWLDGAYTVFGEVTEGMKIVKTIEKVRTDAADHPVRPVRIIKASVVE